MKFALVVIETSESRLAIQQDRAAHRKGIEQWMETQAHHGVLVGGEAFETERVAPVTVRTTRGGPAEVQEGPFVAGDDTLGGYIIVDVEDRQAAISLATTWPASGEALEVRPIWAS